MTVPYIDPRVPAWKRHGLRCTGFSIVHRKSEIAIDYMRWAHEVYRAESEAGAA